MKKLAILFMVFLMVGATSVQEGLSESPSISEIVFYVA
jgi:hypothetical protein